MYRYVIEVFPVFFLVPQRDLDDEALARGKHLSVLEVHQQPPRILFGNFVPDEILQMDRLFIAVLKGKLHDADVAVAAALALYYESVLRRETAPENIIYLARHAFEMFREIFPPEQYRSASVFFKKMTDVFLYLSRKT